MATEGATKINNALNSSKPLLGQLLIENKLIKPGQLQEALEAQKESGDLLGTTLLRLGALKDEDDLLPVLAGQLDVEHIKLKDLPVTREVLALIPAQFATYYKVLPIKLENGRLTIATVDPLNVQMLDEIGLTVDYQLKSVLAGMEDIEEAIRLYYGLGADTIEKMMGKAVPPRPKEDQAADIEDIGSEASISQFLNQIFLEAYKDGATDIHIEPFENDLDIRYRIDGMLYDANVPKNIWHFQDAISSRIKILSNLNIVEKRLPQDGRFRLHVGAIDLDMRVSFLPTPFGESIVLRILNTTRLYKLEELGLPDRERQLLEQMTQQPHGIIFLTGPTGSGKTTTLYSCLSRLNTDERKIITIEDPIEYQLKGITQVQINPAIGLTFAQGLRSMLRHDPDVMMVGEVRDKETATTAVQVSLTGHLIFSTLHTNDAVSGVARLLDMGIEPYLITSTVRCFIAQRLIRRLCEQCKSPVNASADILEEFEPNASAYNEGLVIYEQRGCEACHMTGYSGREAIYEFCVIDDEIQKLILARETASSIKSMAVHHGMRTLKQAGWEKVKRGLTTVQEIIRVTQE